ncbi:MAG: hypothetical protein HQK51_20790 [Oligoflexia bacterium]|nr:hypothetical protein [Oligoflexia bacterium]
MKTSEKCSNNILVIVHGTHNPGAALWINGQQIANLFESDFYESNNWTNIFPENAISELLRSNQLTISDIAAIIYCGKPFSNLEKIILTHLLFFPFHLKTFFYDFKNFFLEKFWVKIKFRKLLKYQNPIYFIDPFNAIARACSSFISDHNDRLIISLHDCPSARTVAYYKNNNQDLVLYKEMFAPNCLGTLNNIVLNNNNHSTTNLKKITSESVLKNSAYGTFSFSNKHLNYSNNKISLHNNFCFPDQKEAENLLQETIKNIILFPENISYNKTIFASNYEVKPQIQSTLKAEITNLHFICFNHKELIKHFAQYALERISP